MKRLPKSARRGNILVLSAFLLPPLAALGAFAIDVGYIALVDGELQGFRR